MRLQTLGAAKRLAFSFALALGATGCAVYPAPYSAYPASSYDGYGGYTYAEPAYAYPPAAIGLGFSYYDYDRGPRHRGQHGWGHRQRSDHYYPGRGRPRR